MSLKERLQEDMKTAMRAGEKPRLAVIRLINAAIKQREVDERISLDDVQVTAVLDKMVKQRRESLSHYVQAGRDDLANQEKFEIDVIQQYLPEPLGDAELDTLINDALVQSGATAVKDMGKVMGILKPQIQGRADMAQVSARIKARLS